MYEFNLRLSVRPAISASVSIIFSLKLLKVAWMYFWYSLFNTKFPSHTNTFVCYYQFNITIMINFNTFILIAFLIAL